MDNRLKWLRMMTSPLWEGGGRSARAQATCRRSTGSNSALNGSPLAGWSA